MFRDLGFKVSGFSGSGFRALGRFGAVVEEGEGLDVHSLVQLAASCYHFLTGYVWFWLLLAGLPLQAQHRGRACHQSKPTKTVGGSWGQGTQPGFEANVMNSL